MVERERLRSVSIFRDLTEDALLALEQHVAERQLEPGEVLFRQGDAGDNCYVILSGELEVLTYIDGAELRLEVRRAGHIVGEMALIDRGSRSATIRAVSASALAVLDERSFFTMMHGNPELALGMLRDATMRQRKTSQNMISGLEQKNAELRHAYEELKAAQGELIRLNRIEEELAVARRIQQLFLPRRLPQPAGWQVAAFNRGAQEVGGDFFDCIELPGGKLGLVVADVSGKGVPAALFVALTRSLVRAASQAPWAFQPDRSLDHEDVLAGALWLTNDYIAREHGESGMFITLFYGLLDPQTGQLSYVNAGHNPPLLIGVGGAVRRELAEHATLPMGIVSGQTYEAGKAQIAPGELLVAFSDGITEAMNAAGEPYDDYRLQAAIQERADLAAPALVESLIQAVDAYVAGAPQADDITLMVIRRLI